MPSEYECQSCKLSFSVGWFHYYSHDGGYWSETLLIRTSCGTVHSVEHPVADSGVAERIKIQPGPVIDPPRFFGRAMHYRTGPAGIHGGSRTWSADVHASQIGRDPSQGLAGTWSTLPEVKCGVVIGGAGSLWMT